MRMVQMAAEGSGGEEEDDGRPRLYARGKAAPCGEDGRAWHIRARACRSE